VSGIYVMLVTDNYKTPGVGEIGHRQRKTILMYHVSCMKSYETSKRDSENTGF